MKKDLIIRIAAPRGFCAGVVRAIDTVNNTISHYGAPVYVLHEIVHNKHVIHALQEKGVIFVESLADIPRGALCIFSAHGVSQDIEEQAQKYGLRTIDATCPLVASMHRVVERYGEQGSDVIIIGHHNHPEVVGTAGRTTQDVHIVASEEEARTVTLNSPDDAVYVTQTTLSQKEVLSIREILCQRFPKICSPRSNVCYATQNRQDAVQFLAESSDLILVVGSKNSSNSNRLREVAEQSGAAAYLIDDSSDIDFSWFENVSSVGITAGASAPERLVEEVIAWLQEHFSLSLEEMQGKEKLISFKPAELQE